MKLRIKKRPHHDATLIYLPGCPPEDGQEEMEVPIFIDEWGEACVPRRWRQENFEQGLSTIEFAIPLNEPVETRIGTHYIFIATDKEAADYLLSLGFFCQTYPNK